MNSDQINQLVVQMITAGWTLDKEDEATICFVLYQDAEHIWFRDYNKTDGSFIHYNSRQKVNLVSSIKPGEEGEVLKKHPESGGYKFGPN